MKRLTKVLSVVVVALVIGALGNTSASATGIAGSGSITITAYATGPTTISVTGKVTDPISNYFRGTVYYRIAGAPYYQEWSSVDFDGYMTTYGDGTYSVNLSVQQGLSYDVYAEAYAYIPPYSTLSYLQSYLGDYVWLATSIVVLVPPYYVPPPPSGTSSGTSTVVK